MRLTLLFFFILLGCAHQGTQPTSTQFSIKEIANQTFVATDTYYHDSNVLVAKMDDESVVIASSPFETQGAEELIKWIQSNLAPRRIIAVNTHFHSDGTGGNDAYVKNGVEVWASDLTKKLHATKADYYRGREALDFADRPALQKRIENRKAVVAPHTFPIAKGKVFEFGKEQVHVIYPGPAHAPDNVVVYLPSRKVLFGGCMIKAGSSIGFLGDADVERWEESAKSLLPLNVDIVIPGHGTSFGGKELIYNSITLAKNAREAKSKK